MRVAYDCHSLLTSPTGLARYTRRLGDALEGLGVELRRFAIGWNGTTPDEVRRWRLPNPLLQRAWRLASVPSIRRLTGRVDLVHGTEFVLPPLRATPGVVTVHDLSFLRDDSFSGARRYRSMVPWSIGRARRVIVPSNAVKDELVSEYGAETNVDVVHEGVGSEFFGAEPLDRATLAKLGIESPFALVVGEVQPRKNLPALVEAWRVAQRALPEWTLVVAGPSGWGPTLEPAPATRLVGWVPDGLLPGLMAAAELFLYPSLYEGFGLPPLEAMATGTAVVAGRYGPAEELLGVAARIVDQTDVGALAEEIVDLGREGGAREELARRGREQASRFTWEGAARATRAVYEAALEGS